jgi:hypothetical protein
MPPVRVLLTGLFSLLLAGACSGGGSSPSAGDAVPGATSPTAPRVTAEPTEPPESVLPADTPGPEEAYQQLLAAIPATIATRCQHASGDDHPVQPGEFASAECSLPAGGLASRVTYRLFDGATSMSAFFNAQAALMAAVGRARTPGCGTGRDGATWDNGRVQCFRSSTGGAQIQWTHQQLYVYAVASREDADFARLEQFWLTAGPIAP